MDLRCKPKLVEGQARQNLLPYADKIDADLIVMGNSAHNAL